MKKFLFSVVCLALVAGCTHSGSKTDAGPRQPSNTGDVGSVGVFGRVPEGEGGRSTPEKMDPRNIVCGIDASRAIYAQREMDGLGIISTSYPITDDSSRGKDNLVRWEVYALNRSGTDQKVMTMIFEQPAKLGSACKLVFSKVQ